MVVRVLSPISIQVCSLSCQNIGAWSTRDAGTSDECLRLGSIGQLHQRSVLSDVGDALMLRSEQVRTLPGDHCLPVRSWQFDKAWNLLLDRRESSHRGSIR